MKNKYQSMSKEEKIKLIKIYKKDSNGKEMLLRLNRLFITGCVGLIFSGCLFYTDYINGAILAEYLLASGLAIMSLIFVLSSIILRGKALNKFAIKQK